MNKAIIILTPVQGTVSIISQTINQSINQSNQNSFSPTYVGGTVARIHTVTYCMDLLSIIYCIILTHIQGTVSTYYLHCIILTHVQGTESVIYTVLSLHMYRALSLLSTLYYPYTCTGH